MVNPVSSFEQTMIGRSPQCYIPTSLKICMLGPEKKILEGFLPHIGVVAILFILPRCLEQTFVPSVQGDSTQKLALTGQAVSEKIFENGG